MKIKAFQIFCGLVIATLFTSCGEYQKVLNGTDIIAKYKAAETYYEAGEYRKAIRLFEQVIPSYRENPRQNVLFSFLLILTIKTKTTT